MKKIYLLLLLVPCFAKAEIMTKKTSQSFLFTRPIFNNIPAFTSLWHDSWFDKEKKNALHASVQYQRSFNSDKLKDYFLMEDRNTLKIRGTAHANYTNLDTDIRAQWLGLPNDFEGTLTIKPEQSQFCVNISGRRSLPKLLNSSLFENMWLFFDAPIVIARNTLNFKQEAVSGAAAATVAVRDIETAFNNSEWNYQKIKTTKRSTTNLGHLRLGFGTTFIADGQKLVATYSALSIPTAKTQNNQYMFQPQVGFNGHWAMVWGVQMQLPVTRQTDQNATCLFLELENTCLIRNDQYRTFDLKNKEFSRFLLLRQKDQTTNTTTPGVNILTQSVRASAYALIDACAGVRFNVGYAQAELGFGAWGHNKERLRLNHPWKETYGIAGTTTNTSASASTIKTLAANDAVFTPIKETDLDFTSASSLATVVYRAHASLGARGRGQDSNALFGCGAFVEIPRNKTTAFSQWGVWVKAGGAF